MGCEHKLLRDRDSPGLVSVGGSGVACEEDISKELGPGWMVESADGGPELPAVEENQTQP